MSCPNPLYEGAIRYAHLGWSVIPLCWPQHRRSLHYGRECPPNKNGKCVLCAWNERTQARAGEALIAEWWRKWPGANVGVVLGGVSRLVGWDIDGYESESLFMEMVGGEVPETLTFWSGGSGFRYLFEWPYGPAPRPCHFPADGEYLTFLGEKSYTVMPPSLHHSGGRYLWGKGCTPGVTPLAPMPIPLMEAVLAKNAPKERTSGGEGLPVAADRRPTPAPNMQRARAYARGFEPAFQGSGGRVVAFKLACRLIHGFGLHPEEALSVMLAQWNHRCQPAWTEQELRGRVMSAYQNGHSDKMEDKGNGK